MKKLYSIQEIAALYGFTAKTVRNKLSKAAVRVSKGGENTNKGRTPCLYEAASVRFVFGRIPQQKERSEADMLQEAAEEVRLAKIDLTRALEHLKLAVQRMAILKEAE